MDAVPPSASGIVDGFEGAVGNTPLIRLRRASEATGCEILGKAEFLNPGQSVKDRAALYIVRDAIERETQMKKWRRAWKVRLIEEMNPDWTDLFQAGLL